MGTVLHCIILSGYDIIDVTFSHIIQAIALIVVVYEIYKKFREIKRDSDKEHERKLQWDYAAKIIKEKEKEWDDGLSDVENVRNQIVKRYDERLDELKTDLETKIDDNYTDTNAKVQEIQSEVFILTECMRAVLDGLHQQGCNGEVTKTRERLDSYLVRKACCGEEPQW